MSTPNGKLISHDGHISMYFNVEYNDSDEMIVFTVILLFRLVDP